jgi:hypothetical protein
MAKKHWSVNSGKTWHRSKSKTFLSTKQYSIKFSSL